MKPTWSPGWASWSQNDVQIKPRERSNNLLEKSMLFWCRWGSLVNPTMPYRSHFWEPFRIWDQFWEPFWRCLGAKAMKNEIKNRCENRSRICYAKDSKNEQKSMLKIDEKSTQKRWNISVCLQPRKPWFLRHVCSENVVLEVARGSKIHLKTIKIVANSTLEDNVYKFSKKPQKWRQNGRQNHPKVVPKASKRRQKRPRWTKGRT